MKKKAVSALLISLAAAVLMAVLAYLICYIVQNVNDALPEPATTVTAEPQVSTMATTAPPETTVPPETTQPPETTVPPVTTEPPETEPPETTAPPTTEAPTTPPETTVPPTTEPEATWIPTEPPETEPPETEPQPTEPKPTEPAPTEPEVKFEEVSETMYVNAHVGVHKGPGNEHKVLEVLDSGDELMRTGIGENGWSRVVHKGKTCYIKTKYLSKTKPAPEPEPTDPPVEPTSPNYAGDGKYYCHMCGKICGDGTNGTCILSLMGDFKCEHCGEHVPVMTCHTCKEDG